MTAKAGLAFAAIVALLQGFRGAAQLDWAAAGGSKGALEFAALVQVDTPDLVVSHSASVRKNGVELPLRLSKIGASGDASASGGEHVFGRLLDQDGRPMSDGRVSQYPDFTSLLVDRETGDALFSLTHFESPRPGIAYLTHLEHDADQCELRAKEYVPVTMADEGGIWVPCSGSVTPWGSHLGSEEYEPDARAFADGLRQGEGGIEGGQMRSMGYWAGSVQEMMRFWGFGDRLSQVRMEDYARLFAPYRYGHAWELAVLRPDGSYEAKKRYALGRAAFELCAVAPDQRTTYCTDDGTNTAFYRFVADTPGDLERGELSCARFAQTRATRGGAFDVEWIPLGVTADAEAELKAAAASTSFYDIFDAAWPGGDGRCPDGFSPVQAAPSAYDFECLRLRDNSPRTRQLAAFLETRRFCAMQGGTTEFGKWEGLTFDEDSGAIYTAVSTVTDGMLRAHPTFDRATGDHIGVEENQCGCIYKLSMRPGSFEVAHMEAELCGSPRPFSDACRDDNVANPDNIAMLQGYNELLIAEDGTRTAFNYMWSYNLATKALVRVATVPRGAEAAGPSGYAFSDVQHCDYFLVVSQHPSSGRAAVHFLGANSQGRDIPEPPPLTGMPTAAPTPLGLQRTVLFIEAETQWGQDMFVRGGVDFGFAATTGAPCEGLSLAESRCAVPLVHLNLANPTTRAWKEGDNFLDWSGREPGQGGDDPQGTPLDWTTSNADYERTVATDGYGYHPLNVYGEGYWMLDVALDCSKLLGRTWFEVKSFVARGDGWEPDVSQLGAPYASGNHFAQCGRVNVFRRGDSRPFYGPQLGAWSPSATAVKQSPPAAPPAPSPDPATSSQVAGAVGGSAAIVALAAAFVVWQVRRRRSRAATRGGADLGLDGDEGGDAGIKPTRSNAPRAGAGEDAVVAVSANPKFIA